MTVRYRRISVRMWGDEKFRSLSAPPPNAQTLWIYLLTGPHTGIIPGAFCVGEAGLAEAIGWPLKGFRRAMNELLAKHMVMTDWEHRLIWIPNALRHNAPDSPNVCAHWRTAFSELPECPLRERIQADIEAYLRELGPAFEMAWINAAQSRSSRIPMELCEQVRKRDGNRCRYCGRRVNWHDRRGAAGGTYDRVDPCAENSLSNIVVSCRSCNSVKGLRTPQQAGMTLTQVQSRSNLDRDLDQTQTESTYQEQEQEQEQEQDQEQEEKKNTPSRAVARRSSGQKLKTRMPDDFTLTPEREAYARRQGMTPEIAQEEFEHFRAHHLAHASRFADWEAAWRTWVLNWRKWRRPAGTGRPRPASAMSNVLSAFVTGGDA